MMDVAQRIDSHKTHNNIVSSNNNNSNSNNNNNNSGPRVSFNRDVHVKRIGTRPNELPLNHYQSYSSGLSSSASGGGGALTTQQPPAPVVPQLRRELPQDLSEAGILKEAARVLKQAESVKCRAEGGEDIVGGRLNERTRGRIERKKAEDTKFNSLPSRKKKQSKPVTRSSSDASAKKLKKPSIFNIFSRKSDTNLEQIQTVGDDRKETGKRVTRSKSDVGTIKDSQQDTNRSKTITRKRNNSETEESSSSGVKKKTQLSPIIEVTQREDYFSKETDNQQKTLKDGRSSKEKVKIKSPIDIKKSGNTDSTQQENLDLVPVKPIAESIKETITTLSKHSKSQEDMHSSQLPPEKPPLTKGVTVDGMVKRLSMERFSPPPHLNGPVFSYTRPNDQIIYAQVVCDNDNRTKQTVHSSFASKESPIMKSSRHNGETMDAVDGPQRTKDYKRNGHTSHEINHSTITPHRHHKSDTYRLNGNVNNYEINGTPSPYKSNPNHTDNWTHVNGKQNRINVTKTEETFYKRDYRNNSDEDEGLGFEIKKGIDEDLIPTRDKRHSPKYTSGEDELKSMVDDQPITPNIRDIAPEKYHLSSFEPRGRADGTDAYRNEGYKENFPEIQGLSQRREILESRIRSRRIGSRELLQELSPTREVLKNPVLRDVSPDFKRHYSPERFTRTPNLEPEFERISPEEERYQRSRSRDYVDQSNLSEQDLLKKYHKFCSSEILNRYSPDRTHLDMIAPKKRQAPAPPVSSSKYVKETKIFSDGRDGVKETFKTETKVGSDGKPHTTEYHTRERLASPRRIKEIDLGYIEDHRDFDVGHIEPDTSYFQQKYRQDVEPRSLESQFSDVIRSSPEQQKHVTTVHMGHRGHSVERHYRTEVTDELQTAPVDEFANPLRRQKKQQRSFDKGDSGIENDYRKDSFNGDFSSRWRRRTTEDEIKACEAFLKKERRHTNETHVMKLKKYNYIYRERSIDDGSHFDPRLDKYPEETMRRRSDRSERSVERNGTLRTEKKISGLEKVKQLFTGSSKKKKPDDKLDTRYRTMEKDKVREIVRAEEEMRSRYREYRGNATDLKEPKIQDIASRRRLSTPKASPLPKRTSSQKSSKSSSTSINHQQKQQQQQENQPQKLGWFKSLDRLSRKKHKEKITNDDHISNISRSTPKLRPLSPHNDNIEPITATTITPITNGAPTKNLRFFGDTDIESNASISKATYKQRSRGAVASNLARHQQKKYSQSAYDLDTISRGTGSVGSSSHHSKIIKSKTIINDTNNIGNGSNGGIKIIQNSDRNRSTSLHNLDERNLIENNNNNNNNNTNYRNYNGRNRSHSRDLHDISESLSASDYEENNENNQMKNDGVSPISDKMKLKQRNRPQANTNTNSNSKTIIQSGQIINKSATLGRPARSNNIHNGFETNNKKYQYNGDDDEDKDEIIVKKVIRGSSVGPRINVQSSRENSRERSPILNDIHVERQRTLKREDGNHNDFRKPPPGPPKPARSMDRRRGFSRERDRLHDSSGTEGDSSQQSQRSVVYLHATTIGDIPQPYIMNARRKAMSREELSSIKSTTSKATTQNTLQPQTRTVSRSISMLAPWKPKHLTEGYEINYSQTNNKEKPKHKYPSSSSRYSSESTSRKSTATLTKPTKGRTSNGEINSAATLTRHHQKKSSLKDDQLSEQSSSLKSSNMAYSRQQPSKEIHHTTSGRRKWTE